MTNTMDAPDYYNPAKDMDKLRAAVNDPSPFDGWPSRWRRCLAAEVVEQAETIIALRGHLEIARAALTARDALLETISAHYSGSLDHQPPYVALVRAAMEKANG